jgi:hypothetical protein
MNVVKMDVNSKLEMKRIDRPFVRSGFQKTLFGGWKMYKWTLTYLGVRGKLNLQGFRGLVQIRNADRRIGTNRDRLRGLSMFKNVEAVPEITNSALRAKSCCYP